MTQLTEVPDYGAVLVAITVAQFYLSGMLQRTLPAGFIAPCLPTKTDKLPSGSDWPHEIKHDGIEGDGPTIFAHTCKMGLEGIVSKRKDSAYRSGRSSDWLKMKNANAPAVMREAEDWGKDDPHAFAPV